jgi:hypothetical protein
MIVSRHVTTVRGGGFRTSREDADPRHLAE